jgi:hypothetical protein
VIENDLQYDLTKKAAERFARALSEMNRQSPAADAVHPVLRRAQEESIRSELEVLRAELREYEHRRASAGVSRSPARPAQ